MSVSVVIIDDYHKPPSAAVRTEVDAGLTIREALDQLGIEEFTETPTICFYRGHPILRADWPVTVMRDNTNLTFAPAVPLGGGGSNPLRIILMIAIAIFVPPLVGALPGMTTAAGSLTLMGKIVAAGFTMLGNMLINAILPPPSMPTPASALPSPDPTYDVQARGNRSRLGEPIPDIYGHLRIWPSYAAQPYTAYEGNEQFLYTLYCIGEGYYDFTTEDMKIEDTALTNFPGATWEVIEPHGEVSLFPDNVETSIEVAGQNLYEPVEVGPFIANASGTQANYLAFDVVAPSGMFYANDSGGLSEVSVELVFWAIEIDDADVEIGTWTTLGTETIPGATTTAIRKTFRYQVTAGRYKVKVQRTTAIAPNSRTMTNMNWVGLHAYLPSKRTYGNVTLVALIIQASNSLSQLSAQQFNIEVTRKLPIWDSVTGWSAPTATRSIAWAFANLCRSTTGGDLNDINIDLLALEAYDTIWTNRGDNFDAVFASTITLWDALKSCARVGRAKPFMIGNIVSLQRHQAANEVAMFTMENILRGSFSINYITPNSTSSDSVKVEYLDKNTWTWKAVTCYLDGSPALKPATIRFFGCTEHDQAWREGMYMCAMHQYGGKVINFSATAEGLIPKYGSTIGISHDMPAWGQSGEVVGYDEVTGTLTCSEILEWTEGASHYVKFNDVDGSIVGPILVTEGTAPTQMVLGETLPVGFEIESVGATRRRTRYSLGTSEDAGLTKAFVTALQPINFNQVDFVVVADHPAMHTVDQTIPPEPSTETGKPLSPEDGPPITNLFVTIAGDLITPVAEVSWDPVPNAVEYIIQQSTDGINWTSAVPNLDGSAVTQVHFPVNLGPLSIRVASVRLIRGPWNTWSGTVGAAITPPAKPDPLALDQPFTGTFMAVRWGEAENAFSYTVAVYDNATTTLLRTETGIKETFYEYTYDKYKEDGASTRNIRIDVKSVGIEGQESEWVTITSTNPQAVALTNLNVVGTLSGLNIEFDYPAENDIAGFKVWVDTLTGFTPGAGNLKYDGPDNLIHLDLDPDQTYYVKAAAYDVWGEDNLNIAPQQSATTTLILSTHISDSAIETPHLAANSVTAEKLFVTQLSAISANIGEVTAGIARSADSNMIVDFNGKSIVMKDSGGDPAVEILYNSGDPLLRVTKGTSVSTITPDMPTVIATGSVTVPSTRNVDNTLGVEIDLGATYDLDDLEVILSLLDATSPRIGRNKAYITIGGSTFYVDHNSITTVTNIHEADGTDPTTGRRKFKASTRSTGYSTFAMPPFVPKTFWDKGSQTSADNVFISAWWEWDGFNSYSDSGVQLYDTYYPITVGYIVLARNYTG